MNNILLDHLKICGLFSDFLFAFCSVRSFVDLLVVLSDRIARVFNRFGATRAAALASIISRKRKI